MDDAQVHFVRSVEDLSEFRRWAGERRDWMAVDTETDGLRSWDGRVRLAQIGDRQTAWAFDWTWWAGAVRQFLGEYTGNLVFHNSKFDVHFLELMGAWTPRWNQVHDSQDMVSLVDGGGPSGLKRAAARHGHPAAARGEVLLKDAMARNGWDWATVPVDFPPYWGYGGLDAILTARLAETMWPHVEAGYRDLYELERGARVALYNMEKKGVLLDMPYVERKRAELEAEANALRSWSLTTHGCGLGSPAVLVEKLQELGAVLTERTDSGSLSTNSVVLTLLTMHPDRVLAQFAANALRYRKATKTASAYFRNFMELADVNRRLHPSIRQMGAKTGRMSVAQPSLQNLTRGPEVRDAFLPSPGNRLVLADYDQIEMRILYHFCRDPNLHAAIMSGDLHTTTARMVYGDPTITKDDPRRQPAKSSGFAKVYGAGLRQFAATAGIPEDEAAIFMKLYSEAFPGVDPFIGKVQATGRQRLRDDGEAWVRTPAGRRQVAEPSKPYTLVNYLIQGTAADVLKQTAVRLHAAGLGEYMVLPVHDEIVFDVPEADVGDVLRSIEQIMPVGEEHFGVPLTVGTEVVSRWGDKYRKMKRDDPVELTDVGVED
jgi:DNA polymerase-1